MGFLDILFFGVPLEAIALRLPTRFLLPVALPTPQPEASISSKPSPNRDKFSGSPTPTATALHSVFRKFLD
ncbi:hypothetical protein [Oscillatoria sp. HE19RPO]|uniref:hypothetical protein n=1 Tax=Oscillatoria sp. HE19RPO TaxID=2954806 RepID=UPI0020C53A50|nr:hypothetical protein [Oscillatoria sp. HE19RPO]